MKKYIRLLRVNNYIKNVLVILPLFFSRRLLDYNKLYMSVIAFFAFCMMSSAVYIINDLKDVEKDREHPIKKNRPIASGEIAFSKAVIICTLCFTISIVSLLVGFFYINSSVNIILAVSLIVVYFILNIAYSFGLKNKPLIDIIILVSGFIIRVMFGGVMVNIEVSDWLYLTVLSVASYMGLGKRRNELRNYKENDTREVLKYYTKDFLDKNMYVCMTLSIIFYALWAINNDSSIILWTVPIVMVMAMKYSLNIENEESDGNPTEVILKDKSIILLGVIYIILMGLVLYIH